MHPHAASPSPLSIVTCAYEELIAEEQKLKTMLLEEFGFNAADDSKERSVVLEVIEKRLFKARQEHAEKWEAILTDLDCGTLIIPIFHSFLLSPTFNLFHRALVLSERDIRLLNWYASTYELNTYDGWGIEWEETSDTTPPPPKSSSEVPAGPAESSQTPSGSRLPEETPDQEYQRKRNSFKKPVNQREKPAGKQLVREIRCKTLTHHSHRNLPMIPPLSQQQNPKGFMENKIGLRLLPRKETEARNSTPVCV